jgi:hypothetical protein
VTAVEALSEDLKANQVGNTELATQSEQVEPNNEMSTGDITNSKTDEKPMATDDKTSADDATDDKTPVDNGAVNSESVDDKTGDNESVDTDTTDNTQSETHQQVDAEAEIKADSTVTNSPEAKPKTRARRTPRNARAAGQKRKQANSSEKAGDVDSHIQPELSFDSAQTDDSESKSTQVDSSVSDKTQESSSQNEAPLQAEIALETREAQITSASNVASETQTAAPTAGKEDKNVESVLKTADAEPSNPPSVADAAATTASKVRGPMQRISHPMANPASVVMPTTQSVSAMSDDARGKFAEAGSTAVLANAASKANAPMATPPSN